MMVIIRLAILSVVLCPSAAPGQSRFEVCRVTSSWSDNKADFGTSTNLLGHFKSAARREPIIKSVKDDDSGLFVTVGVRYEYEDFEKGAPFQITLAATVSGKKDEDVFEVDDRAEAGASYGSGFGTVFVIKRVPVGSKVHRFTLSCRDVRKLKKREFPLLLEIP